MTRTLLVLAALLAASPARALWPFGARIIGPDPLRSAAELAAQGRHEEAAQKVESILLKKNLKADDRRRAYLLIGRSLEALDQQDRAIGQYQVAIQFFPRDVDLLLALAGLFHAADLDDKARPLFERVLDEDHSNVQANLGLAESYHGLGILDRAVHHYREALNSGERVRPAAWREYAKALAGQRDFFNAEQAAAKALAAGGDAEARELLASFQYRQGKLEAALASLDAAIAKLPADPHLRLRRALWLMKAGRDADAGAELERLLAARPRFGAALWARGVLRLRAGRPAQAAADFKAAAAQKGLVGRVAAAMELGSATAPR